MNRRQFLHATLLTTASVALAGCGRVPEQALVSQAMLPESSLPGVPRWYATTCGECANGCGLAVRVIGGRAKKIEGLTRHPLSHGAHCLRADSALQALYHPDRLQAPLRRDGDAQHPCTWNEALPALGTALNAAARAPGSGLIITGPLRGTQGALVVELARRTHSRIWVHEFPGTRVERLARASLGEEPGLPWLRLATADYVVDFGSDFLATGPGPVDAGHQYGLFRAGAGRSRRGIMVSFTSRMGLTAACADRWVPTRPGTEGWVAAAVGTLLAGPQRGRMPAWATVDPRLAERASGVPVALIERLATRLGRAHAPMAVGGTTGSAHEGGLWAMAAVQALDRLLGGARSTTWEPDTLVAPPGLDMGAPAELMVTARQAVEGLQKGTFRTVLLLDCNPAFLLPARLDVGGLLARACTFAFSAFRHESTEAARWVLPIPTWLEEWGDTRIDGPVPAYGLRQPVALQPEALRGSRSLADILQSTLEKHVDPALGRGFPAPPVMGLLQARFSSGTWLAALDRGGLWKEEGAAPWPYAHPPLHPPGTGPMPGVALPPGTSAWKGLRAPTPAAPAPPAPPAPGQCLLMPYPSPVWHDGSLVNRPWLPEVPDPMAQAVWDTWIEIHPAVAQGLGIERGDLVRLTSDAGVLEAPALLLPSLHPEVVAMPVGLGHAAFGGRARGRGLNPMALVTPAWQAGSGEPVYTSTRVTVTRVGRRGQVTTYDWRPGGLPRGLGEGSSVGGHH